MRDPIPPTHEPEEVLVCEKDSERIISMKIGMDIIFSTQTMETVCKQWKSAGNELPKSQMHLCVSDVCEANTEKEAECLCVHTCVVCTVMTGKEGT